MNHNYTVGEMAKAFKALSDPQRIAIVIYLKNKEKCACELTEEFQMAQSKLSYHMKILCESGLVECWYVGKWTHYRLSQSGCERVIAMLQIVTL